MQDRLAGAQSIQDVAQAAADFYVSDGEDDTCVVGVVRGESGQPVFACAGGADEHSLYRIASLSKLFLYPVLLQLHADGRLDLDRPVSVYSKLSLPPECARVTLRDLLENQSGLPREFLTPWNPVDMFIAFHCGFVGSHIYADFDERRAREMLAILGVPVDGKLKTFSKGTREKVQLVLVMARRAKLYLLDEPIGGVDPATRDFILDTIIRNYNPSASVVISTHLIADVEPVLDEVLFIQNGQILLQSSVDSIREEKGMSVDQYFREVFKC